MAIATPRAVFSIDRPLPSWLSVKHGLAYSFQITEAFVNQYEANFYVLGQQMAARFEPYVDGRHRHRRAVEVGRARGQDRRLRHPVASRGHDVRRDAALRRWIDLQDKGWADLVDELDEIRLLANPTSVYPKMAMGALNRAKDDVIYAAGRGSARTAAAPRRCRRPEDRGRRHRPHAREAPVGEGAARHERDRGRRGVRPHGQPGAGFVNRSALVIACSKQLTNLYGTTEIKSVDYNNVKALAQGAIDTFLGFKFIRSERLAKTGTTRFALAWSKKAAIRLGIGKDIVTSIDKLPTKNMSVQVYARMSLGAVRVEDEGVVEIACFE
jgi:hypothetical protein